MKIYPINFINKFSYPNGNLKYINMVEICQGGPEIGNLEINGEVLFPKYQFGGPAIIDGYYLYIPKVKRSILKGTGFILVSINLKNRQELELTKKYDLILLKEKKDNKLIWFSDLENKNRINTELDDSCNQLSAPLQADT